MKVKPLPLNNQDALTMLKDAFIQALKLSARSNKDNDLIALREAINAYMRFIETHDVVVVY